MIKKSNPVVFFGSGPLAAKSLELIAKDIEIEAVITKAAPIHHQGEVPVINVSKQLGLKVYFANSKLELDQLFTQTEFNSSVGLLIDFGIIVSRKVIDHFKKGIVNSHFSVLPEWRGADPITFSLISGQATTGVSLMLLVEAMDEGPLLAYDVINIDRNATGISLSADLIEVSHNLIKNNLQKYLSGDLIPKPQDITGRAVSYSRKLIKADGIINWQEPAQTIENKIRAFIEWPKSRTKLNNLELIITKAHVIDSMPLEPSKYTLIDNQIIMGCGEKQLVIDRLKPNGKSEMDIKAFLAGYRSRISK